MADYIHGIDVSKWQGKIDWSKVKKTQKFAFIRLATINSDGTLNLDPFFRDNIKGATGTGMQVGAYLYSYLESPDAARMAANRAMDIADDYGLSIPVALDYEHAALYQTMTRTENAVICRAFLDEIEAGGFVPVIYTYYAAAKAWLPLDEIKAPRWLANYTGRIGIDGVDIWQYSSQGIVEGIAGRVDMNRAYNGFWTRHPNKPLGPVFTPMKGKVLEAYGTKKTEYFNSLDVNDVAGVLEKGKRYEVTGIYAGVIGGYTWAAIKLGGQVYQVALLDDRCRIVDAESQSAQIRALEAQVRSLNQKISKAQEALK